MNRTLTSRVRRWYRAVRWLLFAGIAGWWFAGIPLGMRPLTSLVFLPPFAILAFASWWVGKWLEKRARQRSEAGAR